MENKRERARDIAEDGLDKIVEGDEAAGRKMIEQAKKIDSKAVDEFAEEVERDKANAGTVRREEIVPFVQVRVQ